MSRVKPLVVVVVFTTWLVGSSMFCALVGQLLGWLILGNADVGRVIGMIGGVGVAIPTAWYGTRYRHKGRIEFDMKWTDFIPMSSLFKSQTYTRNAAVSGGFILASILALIEPVALLSEFGVLKFPLDEMPEPLMNTIVGLLVGLVASHLLLANGILDAKTPDAGDEA